jgi:hypothetical protein
MQVMLQEVSGGALLTSTANALLPLTWQCRVGGAGAALPLPDGA